jgi:hypothetical protein
MAKAADSTKLTTTLALNKAAPPRVALDAPALLAALAETPSAPAFLYDEAAATLALTYTLDSLGPRCTPDDEIVRSLADVVSASQIDLPGGAGHVVTYALAK